VPSASTPPAGSSLATASRSRTAWFITQTPAVTSFAFTQRLIDAGADPSIGSIGDGYDNALEESTIGLYKTELINRRGPWKTIDQVELATLEEP
jgi:transposase InsO family protein